MISTVGAAWIKISDSFAIAKRREKNRSFYLSLDGCRILYFVKCNFKPDDDSTKTRKLADFFGKAVEVWRTQGSVKSRDLHFLNLSAASPTTLGIYIHVSNKVFTAAPWERQVLLIWTATTYQQNINLAISQKPNRRQKPFRIYPLLYVYRPMQGLRN